VIAGVPGLLRSPIDDDPLRVALAVMRIDIEFAVVAIPGQPAFAVLENCSANIAGGWLAGGSDNGQDIQGLLRNALAGDGNIALPG
jgi:hypothetical protein